MLRPDRVKAKRLALGMSQEQLGQKIGVSLHSIFRLEKGTREPDIDELQALAEALNVPIGYLLGLDDMSQEDKQTAAPDDGTALYPNDPRVIPLTNCRRVPLLSPEATAHCGGGCSFFEITSDSTEFIICTPDELGSPIDDLRPPFAVSSEGNCLQSSGISDGDKLVVNPAVEVRDFNVCVICWRDHLSAKRIRKLQNGDIELRSDNGVTVVPADDVENGLFEIWGKVISIHRKLRHNVF